MQLLISTLLSLVLAQSGTYWMEVDGALEVQPTADGSIEGGLIIGEVPAGSDAGCKMKCLTDGTKVIEIRCDTQWDGPCIKKKSHCVKETETHPKNGTVLVTCACVPNQAAVAIGEVVVAASRSVDVFEVEARTPPVEPETCTPSGVVIRDGKIIGEFGVVEHVRVFTPPTRAVIGPASIEDTVTHERIEVPLNKRHAFTPGQFVVAAPGSRW